MSIRKKEKSLTEFLQDADREQRKIQGWLLIVILIVSLGIIYAISS